MSKYILSYSNHIPCSFAAASACTDSGTASMELDLFNDLVPGYEKGIFSIKFD
jgi:hypothetical protein